MSETSAAPPGWYPDPAGSDRQRYWDGTVWTAHLQPGDGPPPVPTGPPSIPPPPLATPPPPVMFPELSVASTEPPAEWATDWTAAYPPRPPRLAFRIAAILAVTALVLATVYAVSGGSSHPKSRVTAPSPLTPDQPAVPRDPAASVLVGLVVTNADVAPALTVAVLAGGQGLLQPTLNLCNGTFPSEARRTARLQVSAVDGLGSVALSTEAVLYSSGAGTTAALSELKAQAAACPPGPVESPVGEPTVTTHFNPAPDGAWPQTPSVERLAFAFDSTDEAGQTGHSVAVYLRRGRALLGLYFAHPEATPPTVQGKSKIPEIVDIFAARLAKLPAASVGTTA